LASEFSGQFIFAKIDIDEQEELKQQFSITDVPTINKLPNQNMPDSH
jgi:putative thioredoxin